MKNLLKLLKNNDYCIVGNSTSEIKKNNGKLIDSYHTVIRFNDYSVDNVFIDDYGSKTDIWVRATNDAVLSSLASKNAIADKYKLIVIRAKSPRNKDSIAYYESIGANFCFMPDGLENELTKVLGACPSTGLLFLYFIYKIYGKIPLKKIFGFSFCAENINKDSGGCSVHYYSSDIAEGFLKSKHNWNLEQKFFNKLIK